MSDPIPLQAAQARFVSGPIEVTLGPDSDCLLQHNLGRPASWVVVGADGPAAYWETQTALPYQARFVSGPIEVTLGPDSDCLLQHNLGRRASWVVVGADGPAAYWETQTALPYAVLALRASVAVTARVCLV